MSLKYVKGSFTVEIAFIMPIILLVIFSLLYLGMDLHDEVCINSICMEAESKIAEASRHSMDFKSGEIQYDAILKGADQASVEKNAVLWISEKADQKLCITCLKDITVNIGLLQTRITYYPEKKIPFHGIKRLLKIGQGKVTETALLKNPMTVIRSIGGINEDAGGI